MRDWILGAAETDDGMTGTSPSNFAEVSLFMLGDEDGVNPSSAYSFWSTRPLRELLDTASLDRDLDQYTKGSILICFRLLLVDLMVMVRVSHDWVWETSLIVVIGLKGQL